MSKSQYFMDAQDYKNDCAIYSNGQSLSCAYRFTFNSESRKNKEHRVCTLCDNSSIFVDENDYYWSEDNE